MKEPVTRTERPHVSAGQNDSLWDSAGCQLAEQALRSSGRLRLRVNGSSMLPAIWPGDVVTIVREGVEGATKGDIVLFGRAGGVVAHRVVRRIVSESGPRLTTRGDSLAVNDSPDLGIDDLLGRVVGIGRGSLQIPPKQTSGGKVIAWICAHSDFALRVILKTRKTWLEITQV